MRFILTISILLLTAVFASAQKNLDAIINRLADGHKGVEIIYSEQRDPVTKKVTVLSIMFTSTDKALKEEIIKAINLDRPSATAFSKVASAIYSITFTEEGMEKSYTLIQDDDDDEWMFSSNSQPVGSKKKK